jgi:hypothetical protein
MGITNEEDAWQRRATAAAVKAVRKIVSGLPPGTQVKRLSDAQWGWIATAILFGWISVKVEQATAEEIDTEFVVRMTGLDPDPMDVGVIAAILPKLADIPGIDWSKPLADWSREAMVDFLLGALRLVRKGAIARDFGRGTIVTRRNHGIGARQASAAAGGPLTTPAELNDPIPL